MPRCWRSHDPRHPADHRWRPLGRPAVRRSDLRRTSPAGVRAALVDGLCAVAGGLLHLVDLLRHGHAGDAPWLVGAADIRRYHPAVPVRLALAGASGRGGAGAQQHVDRRSAGLALRQERRHRRARHRHRTGRAGPVHRAAAEGGGAKFRSARRRTVRRRARRLARHCRTRGAADGAVRDAVRYPPHRRQCAWRRAGDGLRVADQVDRAARGRRLRRVRVARWLRRPAAGRQSAAGADAAGQQLPDAGAARRAGDVLVAAPVPSGGGRVPRSGRRAPRALAVSALPAADQRVPAAVGLVGTAVAGRDFDSQRPVCARPAAALGRRAAGHPRVPRRHQCRHRHGGDGDADAGHHGRQPLADAVAAAARGRRPAQPRVVAAPRRHHRRAGRGLPVFAADRRQRGAGGCRCDRVCGARATGACGAGRAVLARRQPPRRARRIGGWFVDLGLHAAGADAGARRRPVRVAAGRAARAGFPRAACAVRYRRPRCIDPRRGLEPGRQHRGAAVGVAQRRPRRAQRRRARADACRVARSGDQPARQASGDRADRGAGDRRRRAQRRRRFAAANCRR